MYWQRIKANTKENQNENKNFNMKQFKTTLIIRCIAFKDKPKEKIMKQVKHSIITIKK